MSQRQWWVALAIAGVFVLLQVYDRTIPWFEKTPVGTTSSKAKRP